MPKTLLGVLDPQADHSMDIPNPANRRDQGIPDACTACHSSRTPEWAEAELERRFPGSKRRQRRTRIARATALWRDGSPEAEKALLTILDDPKESELIRASAATALGSVRPATPAGSVWLRGALDDPSVVVAARAARSLGTRRERSAASDLARAAATGRDPVALPASLALLDLGDPRGENLVRALNLRPGLLGDYRLETALGILDERRGNLGQAAAHFRRALADRADFLPPRERLARLFEKRGELRKAAEERKLIESFRRTSSPPHG
jgi:hypothetical protein